LTAGKTCCWAEN